MITAIREILTTKNSKPFISAQERCNLTSNNYIEKEYYIDGTANLYGTGSDRDKEALYKDNPYTNRMIARYPKNPEDFNGHIIVEILNASGNYDIDRMWIVAHRYFIQSGSVYIGLTSKPNVFDALLEYDNERYKELSWPNPRPRHEWKDPENKDVISFNRKQDECGLFWDMLTDLADILRNDDSLNPLTEYAADKITLTGWSQSACYIMRYLNSFVYSHNENLGKMYYDAYFLAGPPHFATIPLNQHEYGQPDDNRYHFFQNMDKPCIIVQTESENALLGGCDAPLFNSLIPGKLCRIYDIAGASHDTQYSLIDYYEQDVDLERIGKLPVYKGKHLFANDYPYEFIFNALYRNLFSWIDSGVAPAAIDRIPTHADHSNMKDAFGNAIGGVRTALLEYPICKFFPWSEEDDINKIIPGDRNILFGHMKPFSAMMLKELYGSLREYRVLVENDTKIRVAQGVILQEESHTFVDYVVERAKLFGLE